MLKKPITLLLALMVVGAPLLSQSSEDSILRKALTFTDLPGPDLYVQRAGVQKRIPKYSVITLQDGREGLYLWVIQDEIFMELPDEAGKLAVSADQIHRIVGQRVNLPMATIGFGLLTGALGLFATRNIETVYSEGNWEYVDIDVIDPDTDEVTGTESVLTLVGGGRYYDVVTYYPETGVAFGTLGAVAAGYFGRKIQSRSTYDIAAGDWALSIAN